MGRQDETEAEVRGPRVQPLQALRPVARLPQEIPALPDLLPEPGARGRASERDQGELVGAGRREMSMTDPIADLLTRIRNAQVAKHKTVDVPASKMKLAIVSILADEGFVDSYAMVQESAQGKI